MVDVRAEDLRLDPEFRLSRLLLRRRTEGLRVMYRVAISWLMETQDAATRTRLRMSLLPKWLEEATTFTLKARFSKYSTTWVLNFVWPALKSVPRQ